MNTRSYRLYTTAIFVLAGILYVYFLGGFLRPKQKDQAHAIGILNASGGKAIHPVEFVMGKDLFGMYSLVLTAKVIPPVAGDLVVTLSGAEDLDYLVSSRYPPGVPITNRSDKWYTLENEIFKGVTSGSNLVIVLKIKSPKAPGDYTLTITDENTKQQYFTLPVSFSPSGFGPGTTDEDCHD